MSGVAQVNVYGSEKFAVRIQLDPDALAARRSASTKSSRGPDGQRQPADRHV